MMVGTTFAEDTLLCDRYAKYTAISGNYTFANNEWGQDNSGSQCISTGKDDTVFNATWSWSANSSLVHSYPNIQLESALLPLRLSDLQSLNASMQWTMSPTISPSSDFESSGLEAIQAKANVAFDSFLDVDQVSANSTTTATYEIMIWIGTIGSAKPIGYSTSSAISGKLSLGKTAFTLYTGLNSNGQQVYSWLAASNITYFDEDVSPLIHYLWRHGMISENVYLGSLQFGTETFHAGSNVTFSAQDTVLTVASGTPEATSGVSISGHIGRSALVLFPMLSSLLIFY